MRMQRTVIGELSQQRMLRAVYSERQLEEVLVDFWFNHFNVFVGKGQVRVYLTEYERDAIRPHVLGKFRDLLGATRAEPGDALLSRQLAERRARRRADHGGRRTDARNAGRGAFPAAGAAGRPPAAAGSRHARSADARPARHAAAARSRGLNENYARELMELHTLGVDGGYTQKDVQEVARAFTGWTIANPQARRRIPLRAAPARRRREGRAGPADQGGRRQEGRRRRARPAGAASVDGALHRDQAGAPVRRRRAAGGARRPRGADSSRTTDGDLREVVRTIVTSPEFLGDGIAAPR